LTFVSLCAHLEWGRSVRHHSHHSFSIRAGSQVVQVQKYGGTLRLIGNWRNSKKKKFVWQKLQNYAEQQGVRDVIWVNQLPL